MKLIFYRAKSLTLMWSFVNTMQFVEFMPFCNISVPDTVEKVFEKFSVTRFDLFNKHSILNFGDNPYLDHFKDDYPSRNMLINSVEIWMTMIIIFGIFLTYTALH